ncbi:MAG: 50S ribosomal protein L22 [Bacteroidia bacterium]|jgi:large subunit ribosomal protein L22|nr:50S ribosomal protein L22 [Bacteroidia bacterium]MCO5254054.1 50S ribosomal protein L22 [Bacteroidota bacterium]MCZ2131477.1 50S ribosomal protein L22 [Bacteroidia bacterium]
MEAVAKLKNCPLPPRKMRLVIDQIRGQKVDKALNLLQFSQRRYYAIYVEKLLKSAIANWEQKNDGARAEDSDLFVKTAMVDGAYALKRLRTAPQGRANRMKKRFNHITLIVDSSVKNEVANEVVEQEEPKN